MSLKTSTFLLTLFSIANITTQNFTKSPFLVVSTTARPSNPQNAENFDLAELKEKLRLHDAELNELKNQLQTTRNELLSFAEKQLEHKIFPPQDCKEVLQRGYKTSGMYKIKPIYSPKEFWVWCDLTTRKGGWIYVLNRFDGSENFFRNWTDYKEGFGNISGEFWLGLEHLHHLTNSKNNELLFEFMDWNITTVYENYAKFVVGNEKDGYDVKIVGKFIGDAGDSFSRHAKMKFSTADRDQDTEGTKNCALNCNAGWWYLDCFFAHLTGVYVDHGLLFKDEGQNKIHWQSFHGYQYSLKQAKMMIRPID